MTCSHPRKLLPLASGGDVSGAAARELSEHLVGCPACRAMERELAETVAWLRSQAKPPVSETEYAALRRDVWKRIESVGRERSFPWRRPVLAGAGVLAAAIATVLLANRPHRESPAAAARAVASPSPFVASAEPPPVTETVPSPAPVAVAEAASRPRLRPPARSPEEGSGVDRIEFRTANPNVRIIWLVRKGEEKSSALAPGRNQEVS